ncbi:hypothetical protein [Tardiphaga robiniae]|uniref:hypothetical protein n=1 Tax=Tardiphaga robiniae TaxID=943830 RepID=UPI0015869EE3|nr:hypothetical protein [Tardiphaga robiniae]NUU41370.1 hypothetical protein [Tardiphaga robiniae]
MSLPSAIASLCPDAEWTLLDSGDLATLEWLSADIQRPTDAAIEAEVVRMAALPPAELTVAERLAAAGLTVDDLKVALGLA